MMTPSQRPPQVEAHFSRRVGACGSIMSGHLRAAKIVMAFSTEKSSVGKFSMFHYLIFTASPSVLISVGFSDEGIFNFLHVAIHSPICLCRKVDVNGPK